MPKKGTVIGTDNGKKDVSLTIGFEICLCSLEKKLEYGYVTMFSISIVHLLLNVRNVNIWFCRVQHGGEYCIYCIVCVCVCLGSC